MLQIRLVQILLLNFAFFSVSLAANEPIWLLIDTKQLSLKVKKGNKTVEVMQNISIGRNGAGVKHRLGDNITPLGTYKISWVNNKSKFHTFYGFDYPSVNNANHALENGMLTKDAYNAIINAHKRNKTPPQNTPLGGIIGIHGLGFADKKIHQTFNWTHGCIALTNKQIKRLDRWIDKGILVKIK